MHLNLPETMVLLAVLCSFRSLPSTWCGFSRSCLSFDPNCLSRRDRKKLLSLPSSLMIAMFLPSATLNELLPRREDLSSLNHSFKVLSWSKQHPYVLVISLGVSENKSLLGVIGSSLLARRGIIICTVIAFFAIIRIHFFRSVGDLSSFTVYFG